MAFHLKRMLIRTRKNSFMAPTIGLSKGWTYSCITDLEDTVYLLPNLYYNFRLWEVTTLSPSVLPGFPTAGTWFANMLAGYLFRVSSRGKHTKTACARSYLIQESTFAAFPQRRSPLRPDSPPDGALGIWPQNNRQTARMSIVQRQFPSISPVTSGISSPPHLFQSHGQRSWGVGSFIPPASLMLSRTGWLSI